ncbi:MAG: NUDIX domain-containing protein [Elusimicrobiota bacterium]
MLQQTQVAAALPRYKRFLERFPDVDALARAGERDVLRLWAGLGYYRRARGLLRAAREIVRMHGGRVPSEPEVLRSLPGVGRYTAAAVASIAFGKPVELADGNVGRVFARLFGLRGNLKDPAVQRRVWSLARTCLDRERPGDWNQALMELGAQVCVPRAPACGKCPLTRGCAAFRKGIQESLPEAGPRREPVRLSWTGLRIREDGRLLLWRRSPDERLLPGHWSLPEARHLKTARPRGALKAEVGAVVRRRPRRGAVPRPLRVDVGPVVNTVRHSVTRHRITLTVRDARLSRGRLPAEARWVPVNRLDAYLVSSLWRKAIRSEGA